ncbi:hypothetical protein PFISCL1PPCAC_21070, partial [Pristionchus fissidentatus]
FQINSFESNDCLMTVVIRAIDVMVILLKPIPDPKRVKRALVILDTERLLSLEDDEEREIGIRDATYGVLQSFDITVQKFTNGRDKQDIWIIEYLRRRIQDMSVQSNDPLCTPISRVLDLMNMLQQVSDSKRVKRALAGLDFERDLSFQDDEEREHPLRNAIYGLIRSLHLTLQDFFKIKDQQVAEAKSEDSIIVKEEREQTTLDSLNNQFLPPPSTQLIDNVSPLQSNSTLVGPKSDRLVPAGREDATSNNDIRNVAAK